MNVEIPVTKVIMKAVDTQALINFLHKDGWLPFPKRPIFRDILLTNEKYPGWDLYIPIDSSIQDYTDALRGTIERLALRYGYPVCDFIDIVNKHT